MKNYILFAGLLFVLCIPAIVQTQCHIQSLQSTAYLTGECGGYRFQSAVGSLSQLSGSCGGLFFTPPLTGSDFTSKVTESSLSDIRIFPNPAMDFLTIQGLPWQAPVTADIFTSTGSILVKGFLIREDSPIPMVDLQPGLYFIKFYSVDFQTVIHKFIKI